MLKRELNVWDGPEDNLGNIARKLRDRGTDGKAAEVATRRQPHHTVIPTERLPRASQTASALKKKKGLLNSGYVFGAHFVRKAGYRVEGEDRIVSAHASFAFPSGCRRLIPCGISDRLLACSDAGKDGGRAGYLPDPEGLGSTKQPPERTSRAQAGPLARDAPENERAGAGRTSVRSSAKPERCADTCRCFAVVCGRRGGRREDGVGRPLRRPQAILIVAYVCRELRIVLVVCRHLPRCVINESTCKTSTADSHVMLAAPFHFRETYYNNNTHTHNIQTPPQRLDSQRSLRQKTPSSLKLCSRSVLVLNVLSGSVVKVRDVIKIWHLCTASNATKPRQPTVAVSVCTVRGVRPMLGLC